MVRGLVEVRSLDAFTGQPVGPAVSLGAQHLLRITGAVAPGQPEWLAPETARRLNSDYKISVPEAPAAASAAAVQDQVRGAANLAVAVSGPTGMSGRPGASGVIGVGNGQTGEPSSGGGSASSVASAPASAPVAAAPAVSAAAAPRPVTAAGDLVKSSRSADAGGKRPKK